MFTRMKVFVQVVVVLLYEISNSHIATDSTENRSILELNISHICKCLNVAMYGSLNFSCDKLTESTRPKSLSKF